MTVGTPVREGKTNLLHTSTAADVMLTKPAWLNPASKIGDLRRFFADDHVHAALIVDQHVLITIVERGDIGPDAHDGALARNVGTLRGRVVRDTADIDKARHLMNAAGRRRLAVIDADGLCLGLLCLKSSDKGFCCDADVAARRGGRRIERA